MAQWSTNFRAPIDTPVSDVFIDESGSKSSKSRFFVLGMVKVRDTGMLVREIRAVRDQHKFWEEFKFSHITRDSARVYMEAVETLAAAQVRIGGYVFDKDVADPFDGRPAWQAQADGAAQLVRGNTNKGELLAVHLDVVSTPRGISLASEVQSRVNETLRCMTVVSCLDLDSKCTDLLQMADLVAGSIAYERRCWRGESPDVPRSSTPKALVADRMKRCFRIQSFDDTKTRRGSVNIQTAGVRTARR